MKVLLTDDEYVQLSKYEEQIKSAKEQVELIQRQADKQIANLVSLGDETKAVLNITFLAANRRVQIEEPEKFAGIEFPPFIDDMGELMVNLKAKDKTAHFETTHDLKRIANQVADSEETEATEDGLDEAVQEQCDEEKSDDGN